MLHQGIQFRLFCHIIISLIVQPPSRFENMQYGHSKSAASISSTVKLSSTSFRLIYVKLGRHYYE